MSLNLEWHSLGGLININKDWLIVIFILLIAVKSHIGFKIVHYLYQRKEQSKNSALCLFL